MTHRRLLVRSDTSLTDLHYAIQISMGWEEFHLHRFLINGKTYGNEDANYVVCYDAPGKPTLEDFAFETHERFIYEHDFISWWQHKVRVEKIPPFDAKRPTLCESVERRSVRRKTAVDPEPTRSCCTSD